MFPIGLGLMAATSRSEPVAPENLPEAVAKTFHATFPNGKIEKLDVEEENGVMVYDFEFLDGAQEKETDIAVDGTMLESTLVVVAAAIPTPAMKAIRAAARGGKIGRLERIEMSYELKDGKVVKLPAQVTNYAAEMTRGGKQAEIFVAPDGKVTAAPEWAPIPPAPKAAPGKTPK